MFAAEKQAVRVRSAQRWSPPTAAAAASSLFRGLRERGGGGGGPADNVNSNRMSFATLTKVGARLGALRFDTQADNRVRDNLQRAVLDYIRTMPKRLHSPQYLLM